ncbi:MAG: hypothetical protein Faunusvirus10_17 [Faunusvirus sp.]|jgi:hypothetical protein|uniref:Uncharacterized protein n=1 Tax=Faunusvirus sp. TaxID=2487766 RepID=A0A3G4ZYG1_9VIRU|nr:MAG: hypothetical protein Faunusvirus10_17 [Faunusvirus sp.]
MFKPYRFACRTPTSHPGKVFRRVQPLIMSRANIHAEVDYNQRFAIAKLERDVREGRRRMGEFITLFNKSADYSKFSAGEKYVLKSLMDEHVKYVKWQTDVDRVQYESDIKELDMRIAKLAESVSVTQNDIADNMIKRSELNSKLRQIMP